MLKFDIPFLFFSLLYSNQQSYTNSLTQEETDTEVVTWLFLNLRPSFSGLRFPKRY